MTTVSVLLPVFNGEPFRGRPSSILAQSFADFELLILDDGSTDGSLGTIKSMAAIDPRIRFESRANNGARGYAQRAARQSQRDFIRSDGRRRRGGARAFARQLDQFAQDAPCSP
jgi:glycosyltransferase involved in cell wall biosynthesis